jgi:hypothetical protein
VADVAQELFGSLQRAQATSDQIGATYWAYHLARLGFFSTAIVSSLMFQAIATGDLFKGKMTYTDGSTSAGKLQGRVLVRFRPL